MTVYIGVKHLSLTRLFIFSGVAGFIFLLKEVIKLANYGLGLRKSAPLTRVKSVVLLMCKTAPTTSTMQSPPTFFFLLNATFLAYA